MAIAVNQFHCEYPHQDHLHHVVVNKLVKRILSSCQKDGRNTLYAQAIPNVQGEEKFVRYAKDVQKFEEFHGTTTDLSITTKQK